MKDRARDGEACANEDGEDRARHADIGCRLRRSVSVSLQRGEGVGHADDADAKHDRRHDGEYEREERAGEDKAGAAGVRAGA